MKLHRRKIFSFWTPLKRARLCPNCDVVFDSSFTYCPKCGAQHLNDTASLFTILNGEIEESSGLIEFEDKNANPKWVTVSTPNEISPICDLWHESVKISWWQLIKKYIQVLKRGKK